MTYGMSDGHGVKAAMLCVLAGILLGCPSGPNPERKLMEGMEHAKWAFTQLNDNDMMRLQFEDMLQMGGNLVTFVTSSTADPATLPPFSMNEPTKPWSIALKYGEQPHEFIVEAYGEDLEQPLVVETFKVPRLGKKPTS